MSNWFLQYFKKIGNKNFLFLLAYTLISGGIYFYILFFNVPSDIRSHIQILLRFLDLGSFPTPPLYYALVYGLHFLMPYKEGYAMAALCVLTAAGFLKFLWSLVYLHKFTPNTSGALTGLSVFCLMFFFPLSFLQLDAGYWYLGKFTPTIWHNSTSLLVFPFCILLFQSSLSYLEAPKTTQLFTLFFIGLTIILIKPSFVFPYIPAFPLMVYLKEKKLSKVFQFASYLSLIFLMIILAEKIIIYDQGLLDKIFSGPRVSGIALKPFGIWLSWTDQPIRDLFLSFIFPSAFILLYFKTLRKDTHFIFATLLVLFSMFIFWLFVETGPRHLDGNFYWQIIFTLYIWYLVILKNLINNMYTGDILMKKIQELRVREKLMIVLFLIHTFSGFAYLTRILILQDFL